MIQFALKCENGHRFDSWFQSADAFDALKQAGHLTCAVCGCGGVEKSVMAPRVASKQQEQTQPLAPSQAEQALSTLRKHVEENADYVGKSFAEEARSMYLGATPERAIYGEANGAEAKALIEDGVPVATLPFVPKTKAN